MGAIAATLGTIAMSMLTQLLTKTFIRKLVVVLLEKLVKRTETDIDDKLLEAAKKSWGL